MDIKKFLVTFLTITGLLLLTVASVSAYSVSGDLADVTEVKVEDIAASTSTDIAVISGDTITVKVFFESLVDASNVRLEASIEGEKDDSEARTDFFDVETGKTYVKTLTLKVPSDLDDEVSDGLKLEIEIWNSEYETEVEGITLNVQRPSYNAEILAVNTDSAVEAGELFPVEVVLKNTGYNDLDDMQVTVSIPALNIEKTAYFGDLISIDDPTTEADDDEADTVVGKLYLRVPYDAEEGKYKLEVEVSNDDVVSSKVVEIMVENDFPETVIKTGEGLLILNPTNSLEAYRIVTPDDESIVTVPAGSSKTVEVASTSDDYVVTVLTMNGEIVGSFTFEASEAAETVSNTVVVFTVVLAIIFLVLLIILIVLVTRKSAKSEELGESYY